MSQDATPPRFLSIEQVDSINRDEMKKAGQIYQIRDIALLESAVEMPKAAMFGRYLHSEIHDKAAAYVFHISQNQPFMDGNKRTGLRSAAAFFALNGRLLLPSEMHFDVIMRMARGEMTKAEVAAHFSRHLSVIQVPEFT